MKTTEGFDAIQMWLDAILKRQQQVVQALNPSESQVQQNNWVGYVYANPKVSGPVLNDMKSRLFQDDCKFRMDWLTNPSPRPPPPLQDKDLANVSQFNFMNGVQHGNEDAVRLSDELKQRFMQPGCNTKQFPNLPPSQRGYWSGNLFQ